MHFGWHYSVVLLKSETYRDGGNRIVHIETCQLGQDVGSGNMCHVQPGVCAVRSDFAGRNDFDQYWGTASLGECK